MSDLEKLTAQELLDHIGADDGTEESPLDMSSLKESVLSELNRRLGDKDLVKDIPGTGLIQLAKELLKQPVKPPESEKDTRSIIDNLDALPPVYALRILDSERERLVGELAALEAKRKEINDEPKMP